MDLLSYQRIIFGYHGCDSRVADSVLAGKTTLIASENAYDWLGRGICYWEHGPARAMEWAEQQARRKHSKIKRPAVVGAIIQLGSCLDLLDIRFTRQLAEAAAGLESALPSLAPTCPKINQPARSITIGSNATAIADQYSITYQTVRGVFQEGEPAFSGAGIKLKSHIQIAVRDPRAIIGYFRPQSL